MTSQGPINVHLLTPEYFIGKLLREVLKRRHIDLENLQNFIMIAPKEKADFAFVCYPLSKQLNKQPQEISLEIVEEIKNILAHDQEQEPAKSLIKDVFSEGAYVNFRINWSHVFYYTLKEVITKEISVKDLYISAIKHLYDLQLQRENKSNGEKTKTNKTKKIVIEFSSPNANKPLHLGHLRNHALGESLSRFFELFGNTVVRTNLINDKGLVVFEAMAGYILFGDNKTPQELNEKGDHFVGRMYVLYKQKEKEEKEKGNKLELAHELLKKWEEGDKETVKLWKKIVSWALDGIQETYRKEGLSFKRMDFESAIYDKAKTIVKEGLSKGAFKKKEDGEIIADLSSFNLPDKIVLRSDETSLYITQDIYLAIKRYEEEKFDELIYVVASEQDLHFKQLFAILRLLGYNWVDSLFHRSYGLVLLESGKMKSREGKVVDADDVIDYMFSLAEQEIKKRVKLEEQELKRRARSIGLSALHFYLLKFDPKKNFVYKPEEGIKFEGDTGPYIQYTYARIKSILRKSSFQLQYLKHIQQLAQDQEENLLDQEEEIIRQLWIMRYTILKGIKNKDPSALAYELLELCHLLNNYYHSQRIIGSPQEKNKILFLHFISELIKIFMHLVLVEPLEEM